MPSPLDAFEAPLGWTPEKDQPGPQEATFAASHDPVLDQGVTYTGPYEAPYDGAAEAVRRHALALDGAGMPVFLATTGGKQSRRYEDLEPRVREKVDKLTTCRFKTPSLRIMHTILGRATVHNTVYPRTRITLKPDELSRLQQTTVLMTVHERLTADPEMRDLAKLLGMLAEVWVPCQRNRAVLIAAGMPADRVQVIPHPYDPDDLPMFDKWLATAPKPDDGHVFQFLSVGKWEPRKGQHALIGAFLLAFTPEDKARLAIKTSSFGRWSSYPASPVDSVKQWLALDAVKAHGWTLGNVQKAVLPITDPLPREGMVALHCHADCYVSASRSEGFELPAFDAKLAGKRMVYVRGAGGPEDFSQPGDITVGSSLGLVPVDTQYNWEGAKWSGHGANDIREALLKAYEKRNEPTQRILPSRFSPQSVGRLMRERIESIIERLTDAKPDR